MEVVVGVIGFAAVATDGEIPSAVVGEDLVDKPFLDERVQNTVDRHTVDTGLAAAMALGRSMRTVIVIDSGRPCNRNTPHSHNFLTQDGSTPREIAEQARAQVSRYDTVRFLAGRAVQGTRTEDGFEITTDDGAVHAARKVLFATGIRDIMPPLEGFAECWGISILHCPYCHGYEVRHERLGVLGNGDVGFHLCQLISNWSSTLTLYTNGASTLSPEQRAKLASHDIAIVEKEILCFDHTDGQIESITFTDESRSELTALFARVGFEQHSSIPHDLGCTLTEQGYIEVDELGRMAVVHACGTSQ